MEIRKTPQAIVNVYQKKDDSQSSELTKSSSLGISSAKDSFKKSAIDAKLSEIEKQREAAAMQFGAACVGALITCVAAGAGGAAVAGAAGALTASSAAAGASTASLAAAYATSMAAVEARGNSSAESDGSSESKAKQSDNKKEGRRTTSLFLIA